MTLIAPHSHTCSKCGEEYRSNDRYGDLHCFQCQQEGKDKINEMISNWYDLAEYLKSETSEGKREFRIAFQDDKKFIIHPLNKDGKTIDLSI
jgi:hypothetical protein